MSSTSTDAQLITAWNSASASMNRYFSIVVFLFGTIGNILNALVLSQGTLRKNPCSLLFLVSSLASLISIVSGLTTRMLSGWTLDLTNTDDALCKIRAFFLFLSRNIASWLILLAAVDRWLVSSSDARYRQMSSFKNAQLGIFIATILSILLYAPIFYCYQANLVNAPLRCYGFNEPCRWLNDLSYAILTIILPIVLMLIFGLMTIGNIRKVKFRVQAIGGNESHPAQTQSTQGSVTNGLPTTLSKRRIDRRLFIMLFIQIILLTLFTMPQAIQKIYSSIMSNGAVSPLRKAVENFVFNLVLLLTYLANGMAFYIYTLTGGTLFRNALKDLLKNIAHKLYFNNCCAK